MTVVAAADNVKSSTTYIPLCTLPRWAPLTDAHPQAGPPPNAQPGTSSMDEGRLVPEKEGTSEPRERVAQDGFVLAGVSRADLTSIGSRGPARLKGPGFLGTQCTSSVVRAASRREQAC
jgi:hypothetical protein